MMPLVLMWLRIAGLLGQAVALGSVLLAVVVLRRGPDPVIRHALALAGSGALLVAVSQAGSLVVLAVTIADDAPLQSLGTLLGSPLGLSSLARIALAGAGAALCLSGGRRIRGSGALQVAAMLLLAGSGALFSHAMGRVDGRSWLLAISALHQAAAATWIGGLACAAVLLLRARDGESAAWLRPFSVLAGTAVALLALTGSVQALAYVGTPAAAIGTSYGIMVLTKVVLFTALLTLGAMNHRALRGGGASTLLLHRRVEVEAGLGVVMLCLASSLASAPPAVDVPRADRVGVEEIRTVLAPRWPRLEGPGAAELAASAALGDPSAPRTAADTAWSEFGHNVAGFFVLAMGLLAMLERTGRVPWARHWPLLIFALTAFTAWSMDPEGWQTGAVSFWRHLLDPEVVQHRLLLVLTAAFAYGEWRAHGPRHRGSRLRYAFPIAGILGGVLLLSHVHEVNSTRSAFFMELNHLALGLVSLVVGWGRWLELRLPQGENVGAGRVWAPALVVFGLLLILYREA